MSSSLQPQGLQHARLPRAVLSPRVCPKLCPLSHQCSLAISSSAAPSSSCLQSFPASGFLPVYWLFASGAQSIGASALASVLPMNIQGWFPLRLTRLIFLLYKGLSRVFSNTTVQKHQSFDAHLLYGPSLTSVCDYWENHSFDYMKLCQQSDTSAF